MTQQQQPQQGTYKTFTFSGGTTVQVKPVPPNIAMGVMSSSPRPKPPQVRVQYDPDGPESWEDNPADPSYIAAVEAWELALAQKMQDATILFGVKVEWTEEALAQLEEARTNLGLLGMATTGHDLLDYVKYVLIQNDGDMGGLISAVNSQTAPTDEAVETAMALFPSDVQGAALGASLSASPQGGHSL